MRKPLTIERLRELLEFDPATGIFRWRKRCRASHAKIGEVAGYVDPNARGYRRMCVEGQYYSGHRLAWFYVHGEWPAGHLDHKDGKPGADAETNLRPATPAQNAQNRKRQKNAGYKGVHHRPNGRWQAIIQKDCLGTFDVEADAARAYDAAARVRYGEYARLNFPPAQPETP